MATYYTKKIHLIIPAPCWKQGKNVLDNAEQTYKNFSDSRKVYNDGIDITHTQPNYAPKNNKQLNWPQEQGQITFGMSGTTFAEPLSLSPFDVSQKKIKVIYLIYYANELVNVCETTELFTILPMDMKSNMINIDRSTYYCRRYSHN